MKSLTTGSIKLATASLRANKWRSFLTMLGIIIGVTSVITVVSIGQGVRQQIKLQIDHLGQDLITVRPGRQSQTSLTDLNTFTTTRSNTVLYDTDLQAVRTAKGVGMAVPMSIIDGSLQTELGQYNDGPVIATTPALPGLLNQTVAYGGFFTSDDDDANVAVLGSRAAERMFNEAVPLGRTFQFRGQEFMVRGVLKEFRSPPLSTDVEFNSVVLIPYTTAKQLTHNSTGLYEILAKPAHPDQTESVVKSMRANLVKIHGDAHDFSVLKAGDTQMATNNILNLLTDLVAGVAAVSLFVGGIGIMNIMLVSVTERMKEVGIRKAVGATNRQILNEFMAEATLLSLVGGLIGIVASVIIDVVLRLLTSLTPVISWQLVLLAAGVSILIGILFGSAPALKAARKDPIAALRNE